MTCSGDESEIGGIPRLGCIDSLGYLSMLFGVTHSYQMCVVLFHHY